ncbi:MAG: reverse transcriptase domain-containing protein [Acidobacteriota bacterium]
MRSHARLFERIATPENLWAAHDEARKGKRRRGDVAAFGLAAEVELASLVDQLATGRWHPLGHRLHVLRDPKPRLIAAAPFRDRVVHHGIHRVIAPILTRRFLPESFACLPGRGTHRAVLAFQDGLRKHRFIARLDVQRYFLEIRWDVVLRIVRRTIRDERLLGLLETVLRSSAGLYDDPELLAELGLIDRYRPESRKGLAIGSLTSQLFANLVLDGLDHFAKRELKVPKLVRYMDDIVLFGDRRGLLGEQAGACSEWLSKERSLVVHPGGGHPASTRQTFRFLGHVVSRMERRVGARTLRRLMGKLKAATRDGELSAEAIEQRVASALGAVRF